MIREIQNYIEQRVRYITENISLLPISVKFPFENFIYVYRAKQGYFESRINDALFKRPGSFKYNEMTGKVESVIFEQDKPPAVKKVKSDKLADKMDGVLTDLIKDSGKREQFKKKVMKEVSLAKEKAGADCKVKVKISSTPEGKPKLKIKLVRRHK